MPFGGRRKATHKTVPPPPPRRQPRQQEATLAIVPRPLTLAPRNPNPRRAPRRLPPTQGQLSAAAYRLADELGERNLEQATRDNAAGLIYGFAAASVATAWSLIEAADLAVRCYSGRRKVAGHGADVVGPFRAGLDKAKAEDLARKGEILEALKAAEGEKKTALEGELRELTLRGIPEGRPMRLGPTAGAFLLRVARGEFLPVKGSALAEQDFPRFVRENIRFLDWLGQSLLFTEEQVVAYQATKDADKALKAVRAEASAAPAPEAEKSDEDDSADGDEDGTADQAASA